LIQSLRKRFAVAAILVLLSSLAIAQEDREKQLQRVEDAGDILQEIMEAPDRGIPEEIIASAKCVAIVPSLMKAGFVFGGEYGHGIVSCRTEKGWSAPAFFGVKGGTFGLQIGGQAVDLVMLIMNDRGMRCLLSSKFELGADASVAAGPVGRHAEGATDWKMIAQVLTYSRSRGAFAGVTVKGALITQDDNDTRLFYGKLAPYRALLKGGIAPPADAHPFLAALDKYVPVKSAKKKTEAAK
jgi:lipid-binding SYLF domain-containing protein